MQILILEDVRDVQNRGSAMATRNAESQFIWRASDIIGKKVVNLEGEDVGEIKDLMVNFQDGNVTYAIMSFGGILGIGDKLFAVPWVSLNYDREQDALLMKANKELLKNAPGFDKLAGHVRSHATIGNLPLLQREFPGAQGIVGTRRGRLREAG